MVLAAVSAGAVAGVLVLVKPFAGGTATSPGLVRRSYPNLGFALSVPKSWVDTPVGAAQGVSFTDRAAPPGRGFRVLLQTPTLAAAQATVVSEIHRPPAGRDPIAVNDGLVVGGYRAFRYTFGQGNAYYEEWWIQRTGGTYRIDIWAPVTAQNEVGSTGDRVVRTFEQL